MDEIDRYEVTVARRERHSPWWAPLGKRLEGAIAALPAHRDTRSGRSTGNQVRFTLLGVSILIVVLWNSPWAPLALIGCVAALFVPMSRSRRRQIVASLRAKRTKGTRITRTSGLLEVEPRHITLKVGGERLRRLQRKALQTREDDEGLELSTSKKKSERLLITTTGREPSTDLWIESDDPGSIRDAARS